MERKETRKLKFDYSYVAIGLCFLMILTSLGLCSSGRTLYLTAITKALDIPRSAFSLNDTVRFITTTIVNLFFGKLIRRFGTKKLVCAGFLCLIGFALINSVATSLPAFYVGGVLLGVGLSWTGTTMVSSVINKWCKKNKATFTGAALAANGIGGAIAVQLLSPIIFEEGNPFGYRTSYRLVAVVLAIVFVILLILYREPPKEAGEIEVKKKKKARGAGWVGMEYSVAIKKPYFYVALFSMFLIGMGLQGISGIAVPHMYDIGLDVGYVATVVSLGGVGLTCTKFLTGFLYDRFGLKFSLCLALFGTFSSLAILIFMENTPLGRFLAMIRVFLTCLGTPLETVMLPIFASEFFGNKPFDKLIGFFVSASSAGFAIGSPFGNLCYDLFGDYRLAFTILTIMMVLVAICLIYVLNAAEKDRKLILEQEKNSQTEE